MLFFRFANKLSLFLFLSVSVLMIGCAPRSKVTTCSALQSQATQKSYGSYYGRQIEGGKAGMTLYSVMTKDEVIKRLMESDELSFVSDKELARKRAQLETTATGIVMIEVCSFAIDTVSNPNFKVIIRSIEGETFNTCVGPNDVAHTNGAYPYSLWTNLIACPIPDSIAEAFNVYIVNTIEKKRSGFSIQSKPFVESKIPFVQ